MKIQLHHPCKRNLIASLQIVHNDVRQIDSAPGVTFGLNVSRLDGFTPRALLDCVVAHNHEHWNYTIIAILFEPALQIVMPVFGNDVNVPSTALHRSAQALGINSEWEWVAKRRRELPNETHRVNNRLDTNQDWHSPDVGEKSLRCLVRRIVRFGVLHVRVRQTVHKLSVKIRIGVAHRQHHLLGCQPTLFHKFSLHASHSMRTVRALTNSLTAA
mmetsp:Transcript_5373/g.19610  ORF Transcript_5373/g.19610 Transcript_5373/m.19610 type:complete len:215 (-) Transcript_5373:755-1399(-)